MLKIRRLVIDNFRGLRHAEVHFDDHVVLIGANNCGKTALVEGIALALGRERMLPRLNDYDFFGGFFVVVFVFFVFCCLLFCDLFVSCAAVEEEEEEEEGGRKPEITCCCCSCCVDEEEMEKSGAANSEWTGTLSLLYPRRPKTSPDHEA